MDQLDKLREQRLDEVAKKAEVLRVYINSYLERYRLSRPAVIDCMDELLGLIEELYTEYDD